MNASILEGTFPNNLNLAKVVPDVKSVGVPTAITVVLYRSSLYSIESLKD